MEEAPDMDDLLDSMESDLIQKARSHQPPPILPPTSIGMQPRGFRQNPPFSKPMVVVPKFSMNEHMEGSIEIDPSKLPNTFQPKNIIAKSQFIAPEAPEPAPAPIQVAELPEPTPPINSKKPREPTPSDSEPEPEELSEAEEDTLIPETQIISNLNATDRDLEPFPAKNEAPPTIELDTEMESMLEYLNGFEDPPTVIETQRKPAGHDDIFQLAEQLSGELVELAIQESSRKVHYDPAIQEFYTANDSAPDVFAMSMDETSYLVEPEQQTEKEIERMPSVAEEPSEDVQNAPESPKSTESSEEDVEKAPEAVAPEVAAPEAVAIEVEASEPENRAPEVAEPSEQENGASEAPEAIKDAPNSPEAPEDAPEAIPEATESTTSENGAPEAPSSLESLKDAPEVTKSTTSENGAPQAPDAPEAVQSSPESLKDAPEATKSTTSENRALDAPETVKDAPEASKAPEATSSAPEDTPEAPISPESRENAPKATSDAPEAPQTTYDAPEAPEDVPTIELASEDVDETASDLNDTEDNETRQQIDSSIATIHVLHESDSEDSLAPRRERRLTESELQLGKTSPYWIPDAECPLCMLCNAKFTIITRRHHCRACGRVLCGSCCSEKAVLEYLQEEGKKPQAVRVCKPCSAMLARIEAHEQGEKLRRESVTSEADLHQDEGAPPRGVLKTRAMTYNEEEGASTSMNVSIPASESSRRSVMFRDGVRPGAPMDSENPEDERSTALKPKKKSRKRQSVVKRIAELKMEEELHLVLPDGSVEQRLQILKPGADFPVFEKTSTVLEALCNFSVVRIMLMKNLSCSVQIFNNRNFGLVWTVASHGFFQIGLDELFFSWTLEEREKQRVEADEPELDEHNALGYLPLAVLRRIAKIFTLSTEHEFAGVRRVCNRLGRIQSSGAPEHPLPTHIMLFRPTVQTGLEHMSIPKEPFLVACFLRDEELNWATALPSRLLYKLGEKYNVFPTPFVNPIGRPALYSSDFSGTVLKVFTDFRHWSYRMRHIPGCTVSLSNERTIIRIPKSAIGELKEVLNFSRSMVAWSCDFNHDDDSVLVCEETDPGLYSTQVFAKYIGQRESTSASFVILDGGSKVNALQVNVVEDGVAVRLHSERLEVILNAMHDGHDVVETSKDMEFCVEFVDDGEWVNEQEHYPRSKIDGLFLMNKFQYGLSLDRVLTQALPVQGLPDYEVRLSHVYNLGEGRLTPEEEPRIYGMVEIAAKECVSMLDPHIRVLIASGFSSVSIRLFVSSSEVEYDVSRWNGLEEENCKYRQSLDQLIPMLYNMIDYVPNGFEVEFVLSFVTTRALR